MASRNSQPASPPPSNEESNYQRSPDGQPERKRRRKVLSCIDCRRRKLQCDRVMPACGRCTKAGHAETCVYIDEPSSGDLHPSSRRATTGSAQTAVRDLGSLPSPRSRSNVSARRLEYQEQRIKQLEAALAQTGRSYDVAMTKDPITPDSHPDRASSGVVDRESISLRGRSFKTQFSGSTHPGAMVSYLPELNQFTKEAFENFPALKRMRCDVHALDDRLGMDDAALPQILDQDIKALLPARAEVDELVHLYIDTFDPVYHIIHLPTFWKAYQELWAEPDSASTQFIAIVLLMMACVSCLTSTEYAWRYNASSSKARERSVRWIRSCDDWIERQSQKHVTCADFQIRVLLWLAKQTSARKYKRTWTEAGNLLRFCMSAGLHRNPDLIPKPTSVLDKELRRRIWATAVDFDLQASFDRGMVSTPCLMQSDTTGPGNVYDEDIVLDQPLESRSIQDFTPCSYLSLANDSLMLRSTLNAVLNSIRHTLSFDEVRQYTEEIEAHLNNIPVWIDRRSDVPQALLALRLRQYLLVLHDRHLRQAPTAAMQSFSKIILLENSLQIIDLHKCLIEKGSFALELYCNDALRVALSITHLATFMDARRDLAFSRTFDLMVPQMMLDITSMSRDKVLRFGREARQLWVVLSCDGHLKTHRNPTQRSIFIQQAVEGVISPIQKVIAYQEAPGTEIATELPRANILEVSAYSDSSIQPGTSLDSTLLDLDDLNDWTFQDWFTINDFTNSAQLIDSSYHT